MTINTAELTALIEKATPGPWAYRPCEHDDWGYIRGPEVQSSIGLIRPVVALGRDGMAVGDVQARHAEHRANKTDPYGPNAALIVAAVNALPALLAEREAMREALEQIEFLSTNHGGWFERDAWAWGQSMGAAARTAYEGNLNNGR